MEKSALQQKKPIWDCGSSLYDSFELKSFEAHLESAIITSRRTLSMPHLSSDSDHGRLSRSLQQPQTQPQPRATKRSSVPSSSSLSPSKISRSLQKLIRSVFKSKQASRSLFRVEEDLSGSVSGGLSTIPEVPEMGFDSLPTKAASQRFTASTQLGVSCA